MPKLFRKPTPTPAPPVKTVGFDRKPKHEATPRPVFEGFQKGTERRRSRQPVEGRVGYVWHRQTREEGGPGWIQRKETSEETRARQKQGRHAAIQSAFTAKREAEAKEGQAAFTVLQRELETTRAQVAEEQAALEAIRARQDRTRLGRLQAGRRAVTGGVSLLAGSYRGF